MTVESWRRRSKKGTGATAIVRVMTGAKHTHVTGTLLNLFVSKFCEGCYGWAVCLSFLLLPVSRHPVLYQCACLPWTVENCKDVFFI